jgi:hypothetical protein
MAESAWIVAVFSRAAAFLLLNKLRASASLKMPRPSSVSLDAILLYSLDFVFGT